MLVSKDAKVTVVILERPRHDALIAEVHDAKTLIGLLALRARRG